MDNNDDEFNYLSKEQIDDITDVETGFEYLLERDLFLKYVNNLDDIKEVLRLKYHTKRENFETAKQNEIYAKYPDFMNRLKDLLIHLKTYIELPVFKKEIGEIFKTSESQMCIKVDELKKMIDLNEFPILTAGEAKAGKSTFINLLLGKDLLPMDVVTCTRIICEIKNSNEKTVKFTAPGLPPLVKVIPDTFDSPNQEIAQLVKQDSHDGYTKAVYKYPVSFLENYTFLVDSPGIGDTFHLESMTMDYFKNCAPAFIFVLNATNSNGLTIKAKELIEKAKNDLSNDTKKYITDLTNITQIKEYYFQYHKAVFILNHWDTVKGNAKSPEEVEEVRNIIINEIKSLWHESVQEHEQIFFISARQANEWQKKEIVQEEIINIRTCIKKLIVELYQKNMENSLDLLNVILTSMEKKILQKINTTVDNKYCRLYDKSNAEHLCQILEDLVNEMDTRKSNIKEQLKPKFENMAVLLTEHLKSKEVENRILCHMLESLSKEMSNRKLRPREHSKTNFENIPIRSTDHMSDEEVENKIIKLSNELVITSNDNMDLLSVVFRKILETKLYNEIKLWEEKNKQMENLYSYLNGLFEENLIQISNEIKINTSLINKDSLIKAWNSTNQSEVTNFDKDFITKIEKVFIISTITLLFPVVALAGLLATPLIMSHIVKEKRENEGRYEAYRKDPVSYLRSMISLSLQKLSKSDVKKSFFSTVQKKCEDHIKAFDTFISIEIEEKRQLITDIEKEKREIPEILKTLNGLLIKVENCYGEYHNLRNTCEAVQDKGLIVRSTTYEKLKETDSQVTECISIGKHSMVFKNKHYPSVVFKSYNNKFKKSKARLQMQEIYLLVKAVSNYILRCKQIFMMEDDNVILVLDSVDCNLHKYITDNPELILGNHEKDSVLFNRAFKFILDISIQLCLGLEHLHSEDPRMVHPDLRLDTILVTKINTPYEIRIFICDACSNLPTQRYGKRSGTNLPEESFDMGGYTKENIYRLGNILYKLAHFETDKESKENDGLNITLKNAFSSNDSVESMEAEVKINWKEDKHNNIPSRYNELVKNCLSVKPENRPTIQDCIQILKELKPEMGYL